MRTEIKWIPIKERLPEKADADGRGGVLIWCGSLGAGMTRWDKAGLFPGATHWAPGVLPPAEEEKAAKKREILREAQKWGLPTSQGHMEMGLEMAEKYSAEWLFAAMARAAGGKDMNWGYVEGILKSWARKGGMDERGTGRRQNYGKKVSAQCYAQREYTEEEMLAISDNLFEEARKMAEMAGEEEA